MLMTRRDVLEDETKALDLFRDAIGSLSEGLAICDADHRLALFNKRFLEYNNRIADLVVPGTSWETLLREAANRGVYADAIGREEEWVGKVLENNLEFAKDFEMEHSDGRFFRAAFHPTKAGGFVVTLTEITDEKHAEAVARDNDTLIRKVLDASPANVVMARLSDSKIIYHSPAALELFGEAEYALDYFCNPQDRAAYISELLANKRLDDYSLLLINARGERFRANVSGRLAEYRGEPVVLTATVDMTEQIEAQELIRQVLEACPVPIQMLRAESGEVLFSSPETTALFGAVKSARSYYAIPEDRQPFLEALREHGLVKEYQADFVSAGGRRFRGAVSARLIIWRGEEVIVSHTRDMTDQLAIEDELAHQREQLFQNEKMSALGELLAGVAHELNNPLSVVVGHALMLAEDSSDPETIRQTQKISSAAERCAKIVKTFLAMARQQPTRMERTDVNAAIRTAADVAGYGNSQGIGELRYTLTEGLPEIVADSDQIAQVIINLVLNASHAIDQSGKGDRIEVTARAGPDSKSVEIIVEDNGPGIPKDVRGRIFEPFFTTKDVGEGTGIGLAFCHRTIHSHNGEIWLDNSYKDGCRFRISLPAASAPETPAGAEPEPAPKPAKARVLIVDDEPDVADIAQEVLQKAGYDVDIARNGADALSLLNRSTYDALLSDLNMPKMDGRGLFDAIRKDFPDMIEKTGFITGDSMGESSRRMLREAERPFLEKPVVPPELRSFVESLLNGAQPPA